MKFIFLVLCMLGFSLTVVQITFAQDEHKNKEQTIDDTNIYYDDYSDLLAIRLYTNTKWNGLDIVKDDHTLKLRPNSPTSLGVGFNYKSYGLGIAIGIPKSSSSNEKYVKTNRLDLQVNAYGRKFGMDGYLQYYKGYYWANPEDFTEWTEENYPKIPEMEVFSFGLNAFYIFNSDRFSYKAAFVRNQVQRKSAGSITAGIFSQMDIAQTDNGFIPAEVSDSLGVNFDLRSFRTAAIGLTVGYLYTWVISEHFFLNVGLTPGFGNQTIQLEKLDGTKSTKNEPAAQLSARGALGYDSRYFYAGITASTIWRNFTYGEYELDLATEQLRFFIGKRFALTKKRK